MRELYQKNKLFFLILIAGILGFLVWYFSNIVIFIIVAGVIMPMTIRIIGVMFVVQTIDNSIFAPLIQGKSMKAYPVEIFLVVIAATSLGGITRMIVAVPAYGFVKIIAHEFLSNFRIIRHISENR